MKEFIKQQIIISDTKIEIKSTNFYEPIYKKLIISDFRTHMVYDTLYGLENREYYFVISSTDFQKITNNIILGNAVNIQVKIINKKYKFSGIFYNLDELSKNDNYYNLDNFNDGDILLGFYANVITKIY